MSHTTDEDGAELPQLQILHRETVDSAVLNHREFNYLSDPGYVQFLKDAVETLGVNTHHLVSRQRVESVRKVIKLEWRKLFSWTGKAVVFVSVNMAHPDSKNSFADYIRIQRTLIVDQTAPLIAVSNRVFGEIAMEFYGGTHRRELYQQYFPLATDISAVDRSPGEYQLTRARPQAENFLTEVTRIHILAGQTPKPDQDGDLDGDADFDANDSFLMSLILLAGTDEQIDQSKGISTRAASQIRTALAARSSVMDVDGDGDVDANDGFLIHLVQLAGTNEQINLSKGLSPLSATEIRTNVNGLSTVTANYLTATSPPVLQSVQAAPTNSSRIQGPHSTMSLIENVDIDRFWTFGRDEITAPASDIQRSTIPVENTMLTPLFREWIDML
jgi:hypothetical protein